MRSEVAVVSAFFNRADYAQRTIESVLSQNVDGLEIVVVNDGSTDPRLAEVLNAFEDKRLKVIHQANMGFTKAIKRAIASCDAPYIAMQGAGDVSLPGRLQKQKDILSKYSSCALVGCYYEDRSAVTGTVECVKPVEPRRGAIRFRGLSHGELMYRRTVYNAVGGYRPAFEVGQGSDLWMRLLREHDAFIVPEVLYQRWIFEDGVSRDPIQLAKRRLLNGLREENELHYRKTGTDQIDLLGAAAFGILGCRGRGRRGVLYSSLEIENNFDLKSKPSLALPLSLQLAAGFKRVLRKLRVRDS